MRKRWTEPIPFKDRIDKITLTGKTIEGETVSITLLPEEIAYIESEGRETGSSPYGCTHLEVCHISEMGYCCNAEGCGCGHDSPPPM